MKLAGTLAIVVLAISGGATLNQTHVVASANAAGMSYSHGFQSVVEAITIDDCLKGLKRTGTEEKSTGSAKGIIHFQCHTKVSIEGPMDEKALLDSVEKNIALIFSKQGLKLRRDRGHARRSFFQHKDSHGYVSLFVGSPDKESNVYVTVVATEADAE